MNAFGRRGGPAGTGTGTRSAFGIARPPSASAPASPVLLLPGGGQFPPLTLDPAAAQTGKGDPLAQQDPMARLAERLGGIAESPASASPNDTAIPQIKEQVLPRVLERIDSETAASLGKEDLISALRPIIAEVLSELAIALVQRDQLTLEKLLIDELLGFGPLENLLCDPEVSDILVNGPDQTYIEKKGRLQLAPIRFRDEAHLRQIAQRLLKQVGHQLGPAAPLADARLKDGSRIHVITPPLSLRGTAISIRKPSDQPYTLDMLRDLGAMSKPMATVLKIAGACRMNIIISGGTGAGKTTMLNAMARMIDPGERVLTIEEATELHLQQPHWLPLEARLPNLDGQAAITTADLVKNALRMRPDRIILGEIRGAEGFDLLTAMATGHDGSMATLYANSPAECLARLESMIMMGDLRLPRETISGQIADCLDLIVQVKRLRDGSRRTTSITEVVGISGEAIVTRELFSFAYREEGADGTIIGEFHSSGLRPNTLEKARQFGFDQAYLEACQ